MPSARPSVTVSRDHESRDGEKCGRIALVRSLREGPKDEADLVAEKRLLGKPGELTGDYPGEEFSAQVRKRHVLFENLEVAAEHAPGSPPE
jgi:hypothetical protein